ncbi:MAG: hypothetical protein RIR26_717 [Pseudomonadota bacterium]
MNRIRNTFAAVSILALCAACVSNRPLEQNTGRDTEARLLAAVATDSTPRVQVHSFKKLPLIGTSYFPKVFSYPQGGWSGVSHVSITPQLIQPDEFWTVNDRGLNLYLSAKDAQDNLKFTDGDRYFPEPHFNQSLFRIKISPTGEGEILEQLGLFAVGAPTNGLPSSVPELATGEKGFSKKSARAPFVPLPLSVRGFDFEGVAQTFDKNGQREFWLVEEYGPSILRADAQGHITHRWSPSLQNKAILQSLPWVYRHRGDNRGFEGLTVSGAFVLAALQSPLDAAGGRSGEVGHGNPNTPLHRMARLNRETGAMEHFAYNHTSQSVAAGGKHKDVKIGDLAAIDASGERFLVLEHSNARKHMVVVEARITPETTRLEDTVAYEAGKIPYTPVSTRIVADLAPLLAGLELPEKAEGITFLDPKTLLIVFDNDHCIEPLLAAKNAPKECENLAVTIGFPKPLF